MEKGTLQSLSSIFVACSHRLPFTIKMTRPLRGSMNRRTKGVSDKTKGVAVVTVIRVIVVGIGECSDKGG